MTSLSSLLWTPERTLAMEKQITERAPLLKIIALFGIQTLPKARVF
jgi:hypothetical protein